MDANSMQADANGIQPDANGMQPDVTVCSQTLIRFLTIT
jgi:hypothetical protein